MSSDTTWEEGIARLDGQVAQLREKVAEIAVQNILLADGTEQMRRRFQERFDLLGITVDVTLDKIQDHAADPDAHEE